ncbi:hypothetical protein JOC75_004844 [Metabacillus crassostreae]|uniref:ribosomal maturation YjgA family protein n=1 Tax=Metabacillus crassostreae TaxID=929098 RepID=UPI00195A3C6B|nr:DUF2809 domain-containing protein [Metabacillus crassostreae]MBM7606761.1 hypothetical protein [Metabacillus crassostreae]
MFTNKGHFLYKRSIYILAIVVFIALGLTSRKSGELLPILVAQNAGDILWAMMVYYGFRFLLVHKSLLTAFFFSLTFCFIIEFSQLYQAEWINHLRSYPFGALVLGKGYLTVDLIRYTVGILIAATLDKAANIR